MIGVKECVYTRLTRKYTVIFWLVLKLVIDQSLWPSSCFVSWVRPLGAPNQGIGAFHAGESIEAVTVLSQKMRAIWLFEQRMWANSWTSLLGSVWNSLGTAAAEREDAASSPCAQHTARRCFPYCSFHKGSTAVVHFFGCGSWTALHFAR